MRIPFFFVLLLSLAYAQMPRQVYFDYNYFFVAASNVNMREAPSLGAPVVAKLQIGEQLKRVELEESARDTIGGVADRWQHVTYGKVTGFVWRPLLAYGAFKARSNPDILFLLANVGSKGDSMKIMILKAGEVIQTETFAARKHKLGGFTSIGKMGLDNVEEIICVQEVMHFCGDYKRDIMYAWDGEKLHHFFTAFDGSESDGSILSLAQEYLLFPSDIGGKKGLLLYYNETGDNYSDQGKILDDRTFNGKPVRYLSKVHKQFFWNGKKLIELK